MSTFSLRLVAALILSLSLVSASLIAGTKKLTLDERVELMRGLTAEFATVKAFLPRSKKPLPFDSNGTYDKTKWDEVGRAFGPAARLGDQVQITRVAIEDDRIVLEINGGLKGKGHWYDHVQVGVGGNPAPVSTNQNSNAASGTTISVMFHQQLTAMQASDVKKILAPVLDFDKHSATEQFAESLPPEVKQAIADNKAIEGMDRDQVIMSLGKPRHKTRETKDGIESEDWIYGDPPGKITFVTFNGSKVVRVKEAYASIGGSTAVGPDPVR